MVGLSGKAADERETLGLSSANTFNCLRPETGVMVSNSLHLSLEWSKVFSLRILSDVAFDVLYHEPIANCKPNR